jgi:hypothetical protein
MPQRQADPLPAVIRLSFALIGVGLVLLAAWHRPLLLIACAVGLVLLLMLSKLLGDLLWQDGERPDGAKPQAPTSSRRD